MINKDQIETLEDFLLRLYAEDKRDGLAISGLWEARLTTSKSVKLIRIRDYYSEIPFETKRVKTEESMTFLTKMGDIDVKFDNAFKGGLKTGDILNFFLNTFTTEEITNDRGESVDREFLYDTNAINKFLKWFLYPPIDVTKETEKSLKYPVVFMYKGEPRIDEGHLGKVKSITKHYAVKSRLEDYLQSFQMLVIEVLHIILGKRDKSYDLTYDNKFFGDNEKTKVVSEIIFDSLNSLIFFECFEALKKYSFYRCPYCKSFFVRNRRQKKCPFCKPVSKYTKSELGNGKSNSPLLSLDYERKNFLKKINRRYGNLKDHEKNKLLIENGFEPLKHRVRAEEKKVK